MKKVLFLVIGLSLLTATTVQAAAMQEKKLGIGLNVGEPIGLNGRYQFTEMFVGDLTVGYGFVGERSLVLLPGALIYLKQLFSLDSGDISLFPYFGAGLKMGVDTLPRNNAFLVGMRIPLGWNVTLMGGQLEISAEYGPGVRFNPNSGFDYTGSLGVRYYFY